jgi:hypothetical protein
VEIYFEPYCTNPAKEFRERHERDFEVSKWGIIGARGQAFVPGRTWYNHMSAGSVVKLIGPELWSRYYKFCVVRNPFDKLISAFWHNLPIAMRLELQCADFESVRRKFQEWLRLAEHVMDRDLFLIGNRPVMDRFVRYEDLHSSLEGVCHDLGLPWDPLRLGRYKSEARVRREAFADYYDRKSAADVREWYKWEFEYFQYPPL